MASALDGVQESRCLFNTCFLGTNDGLPLSKHNVLVATLRLYLCAKNSMQHRGVLAVVFAARMVHLTTHFCESVESLKAKMPQLLQW